MINNSLIEMKNLALRTIESNNLRAKNRKLVFTIRTNKVLFAPNDLGALSTLLSERVLTGDNYSPIKLRMVIPDTGDTYEVSLVLKDIYDICKLLRDFSYRIDLLSATDVKKVKSCKNLNNLIELTDSLIANEDKIIKDYMDSLAQETSL